MPPDSRSLLHQSATHACTRCGEDKPLDQFYKHRTGNSRAAWYCDPCAIVVSREWRERTGYTSTDAVRRYRDDPDKAERDRARSRAWKAANRERNRARDREYSRREKAA